MYKYYDEKGEHMHTKDEKPLIGTSTVMKIVAKVLTWWAAGLAVSEFGWVKKLDTRAKPKPTEEEIKANEEERKAKAQAQLELISKMSVDEYLDKLDKAYKAHSVKLKDSAEGGTDMHAELEKYIKEAIEKHDSQPFETTSEFEPVKIFSKWCMEHVKKFLWSEMHCFSETMWTGGISDCGIELKDGKYAIIDFKSAKEAYATSFWQIAGYAIQIEENGGYDKDGNKTFTLDKPIELYYVLPFGAKEPQPVGTDKVIVCKEAFKFALGLYKCDQNFTV